MKRVFFLPAALILMFALGPATTGAQLSYDPFLYRHAPDGCSSSRMGDGDWINVIFTSSHGLENVEAHINHHLGWRTGLGGSVACFLDHEALETQDGSLASHSVIQERWHIRLNESRHGQDVLAAVHYDECNPFAGEGFICFTLHDGTNFQGARDKVALAFSQGGHPVTCGGLSSPQCGPDEVVFIRLAGGGQATSP